MRTPCSVLVLKAVLKAGISIREIAKAILSAPVFELLGAQIRDHPAVALADQIGQLPSVHQTQTTMRGPLAHNNAVFLHAPGYQARADRVPALIENFQDKQGFSFDIFGGVKRAHGS